MVTTASASPVATAFAVLNETSLALHIAPAITPDFTNSTLKQWPSEVEIPGFPYHRLSFIQLGPRGTLAQREAVLEILENRVKQWRAGEGMSI